jgi:hypothetical protein
VLDHLKDISPASLPVEKRKSPGLLEKARGSRIIILRYAAAPSSRIRLAMVPWAGLLAPGSSYSPRLPDPSTGSGLVLSLHLISDLIAAFVPGHSGGSATDLHRLPLAHGKSRIMQGHLMCQEIPALFCSVWGSVFAFSCDVASWGLDSRKRTVIVKAMECKFTAARPVESRIAG